MNAVFSLFFPICLGEAFITVWNLKGKKKTKHASVTVCITSFAVRLLQLKFADCVSFPKLMLCSLSKGNKVTFELSLLGDEIIMQEHSLGVLLRKPLIRHFPID